jgi:hypothetical protein
MPKFAVENLSVTPEEFIEACTPRDMDRVIEILKEDFEDEFEQNVHPSVEKFLNDCNHFEKEEAFESLKDEYGFDEDNQVRSESQRQFNYYLSSLKNGWLSVTREDADIIAILAKKYGAV